MPRPSLKGLATLIAVLVSLLIIFQVSASLNTLAQQSRVAGLNAARDSLRRVVVQCYALEGGYPPDLQYMSDYYGLQVDESRYIYLYEYIGGNLFPVFEVTAR